MDKVYRDRANRCYERYSEPFYVSKTTPQRVYVYREGQDGCTFVLDREELESKGWSSSRTMRAAFCLRPRAKREVRYFRGEIVEPDKLFWFYQELGLEPPITRAELKKAYRQKAKDIHPDAGGSHEDMIELIRAYEIAQEHVISGPIAIGELGGQ